MISQSLRDLAAWLQRHADQVSGLDNQFAVLGLSANLEDLADQAQALESATLVQAATLHELPPGVVRLADRRRAAQPAAIGGDAA